MSITPFVYVDTALAACRAGDVIGMDADTAKHVTTVLRLKPTAPVLLSDGCGAMAAAEVHAATAFRVTGAVTTHAVARPAVTLIQAIPKLRKLDTVIRLATEGGVARVWPVATARSQATTTAVTAPKMAARLAAIARAAGEQARRPHRLEIVEPAGFAAVFAELSGTPLVLFDPEGDGFRPGIAPLLDPIAASGSVGILIGPEGGFTPEERAVAVAHGAAVLRLSDSVLRTEHAGLAAVFALGGVLGRFDGAG